MQISYHILNPAPKDRQNAIAVLSALKSDGCYILGFEVTIQELAALCHENIDPQHTQQRAGQSATQETLDRLKRGDLIPPGIEHLALVTVRADLDAIGAMALIKASNLGVNTIDPFSLPAGMADRIRLIHDADSFSHGEWQPRPLFATGYESPQLRAIARAVADYKIPPAVRVTWAARWLHFELEPEGYREKAEQEQSAIVAALESGETSVYVDGSIALVESRHMAAQLVAYSKAPIGIAFNPVLPWRNPDGSIGCVKKASIFQHEEGLIDMPALLAELQRREPGWNGSPTFIGSTQGQDCLFTPEELLAISQRHVKQHAATAAQH